MVVNEGPIAVMGPLSIMGTGTFAEVLLALVLLLGGPFLLRWLWNMTLPAWWSAPVLDYWMTFRLIVMVALLGLVFRLL
ncbi:MAG: hypothetical protein M1600_11590 [Firmicutes bacterium]|nr:hypothetical protein [Bacillota bacterium]